METDSAEDGPIIRRVLAGDREAFIHLVRRYQHRLRVVVSFYCISAQETEELLHETFVQAYVHLSQFHGDSSFYAWLKSIAINALRMELRRKGTRRSALREYFRRLQMADVEKEEEGARVEARRRALQQCLKELPRAQADLLEARYRDEVPLAELAGRLDTTLGALKVRLLRLREALRDCVRRRLGPEWEGGA